MWVYLQYVRTSLQYKYGTSQTRFEITTKQNSTMENSTISAKFLPLTDKPLLSGLKKETENI